MKKIFLQMPSPVFAENGIFNKPDPYYISLRWRLLKTKLAERGYELTTADNRPLNDCVAIIFQDAPSLGIYESENVLKRFAKKILGISDRRHSVRDLYSEGVQAGLKEKMILILNEGKIVFPMNFSSQLWNMFGTIMTWDDDLLKDSKFSRLQFSLEPYERSLENIPFTQKKLVCNISIDKYSKIKGELYSARRKAVAYFDRYFPFDFDLYGSRWNTPHNSIQKYFPFLVKKYATYRGCAEDKIETLSHYKFNICYENNGIQKGYTTEKIFDSFQAGCVPIYWGATNIDEYADPAAFIDRRKFKNDKELADYIIHMTEKEHAAYIKAGKQCLTSEKCRQFLPETFVDNMIKSLGIKDD